MKGRKLAEGAIVWIPCKVKQGMVPTERYVLVNLGGREITGFIPAEDVEEPESRVKAVVTHLPENKKRVALLFRGEIFRDTNPVTVEKDWLDNAM